MWKARQSRSRHSQRSGRCADTLSYVWAVLKGGAAFTSGSGATFTFTPDDNASDEIGLTVSDEDGGSTPSAETISSVTMCADRDDCQYQHAAPGRHGHHGARVPRAICGRRSTR